MTEKTQARELTPNQVEFLGLVVALRDEGWTVVGIAKKLGVHYSTVSRWDRSAFVPHEPTAKRLLPKLRRLVG